MQLHIFFILVFTGAACTLPKKTGSVSTALNGTWIPTKQELGGKALPPASLANQKLIIADSSYTFVAESVDKGVIYYTGDKLDIYGKEGVNAGRHITGIYKLVNGELSICYNLLGDSYPQSFETSSKPTLFLSVFRKE